MKTGVDGTSGPVGVMKPTSLPGVSIESGIGRGPLSSAQVAMHKSRSS